MAFYVDGWKEGQGSVQAGLFLFCIQSWIFSRRIQKVVKGGL